MLLANKLMTMMMMMIRVCGRVHTELGQFGKLKRWLEPTTSPRGKIPVPSRSRENLSRPMPNCRDL